MKKHAYLIMAHNEFEILRKLILLLDDKRNDIYLNVDKKARAFNIGQFNHLTKESDLIFVKRNNITWGAYSQINGELVLLKEAVKNNYDYYHLLSGVDLPIKNQEEIHEYFDRHSGTEFLFFHHEILARKSFYDRIQYYHFFQENIGHKKGRDVLFQLNKLSLQVQRALGINRIKKTKSTLKKGTTWFSITHALAKYVVFQENIIRKAYKFTQCADEVFLHTIAWNSDFKENICENSLRCIDWKRGRPYTFREDDFEPLMRSDAFWARKFNESIDARIVEKIFQHLMDQKNMLHTD